MTRLMQGTAKRDITPDAPVPMAGFGHRKGVSEGVLRRLTLRALSFEQEVNGRTKCLVLVQADIIWWGSERMEAIRSRLAARWGLAPADVVLSATHTHGGPQTSSLFVPTLGLADAAYLNKLERALEEAIEEAAAKAEPVTVEQGKGECRIGINRRLVVNGEVEMAPNPDGDFDPEVTVVRFVAESGEAKAILYHYSCHPTTSDVNRIHADFPGVASDRLESDIGGGAVALFLQGCCGDIRPSLHRDGAFYRGDTGDIERFGDELADAVTRVLASGMERLEDGTLFSRQITLQLPYAQLPSDEELEQKERQGGHFAEWAELLRAGRLRSRDVLEMTRMDITRGLSLLTFNGEMVLAYARTVKVLSGGSVLPLGYCNGMIGYVPTTAQLAEGGYEAEASGYYFGMPSPFDPAVETIIREGIESLLADCQNHP